MANEPRIKSELQLTSSGTTNPSVQVHCCSCHILVDRVFTRVGRIFLGTQFVDIPKLETELSYDENNNLVEEEEVLTSTKRPIGKWASGNICDKCYLRDGAKMIQRFRKVWTMVKGKPEQIEETYYEPMVKIEDVKVWTTNRLGRSVLKPSHQVAINPGWSKADQNNLDLEYNPESVLWSPPAKPYDTLLGSQFPVSISKPRDGFQQVQLREKVDSRKAELKHKRRSHA